MGTKKEVKWTPSLKPSAAWTPAEYWSYEQGFEEAIKTTAARELYEALDEALSVLETSPAKVKGGVTIRARAALAKARGECEQ
jgi:hypothetical protein